MNRFICEELTKLQKIYQLEKDLGRKIAYLKAISAIKTLDHELNHEEDIEKVKGIGKAAAGEVKKDGRIKKSLSGRGAEKRKKQFNQI